MQIKDRIKAPNVVYSHEMICGQLTEVMCVEMPRYYPCGNPIYNESEVQYDDPRMKRQTK